VSGIRARGSKSGHHEVFKKKGTRRIKPAKTDNETSRGILDEQLLLKVFFKKMQFRILIPVAAKKVSGIRAFYGICS
jgi:hypothetical protein